MKKHARSILWLLLGSVMTTAGVAGWDVFKTPKGGASATTCRVVEMATTEGGETILRAEFVLTGGP
jgi:hypothetical protein